MGEWAAGPIESAIIWIAAFAVYATNAYTLSAVGGGCFGDLLSGEVIPVNSDQGVVFATTGAYVQWSTTMWLTQAFFLIWNIYIVLMPIKKPMRALTDPRDFGNESIDRYQFRFTNGPQSTADEDDHAQAAAA